MDKGSCGGNLPDPGEGPGLVFWREGYLWADWTGFGDYIDPLGGYHRAKTFWDWLELLIIPAVLGLIALLFNAQERKRDREREELRREGEREFETERMREGALQNYLDHMTDLLSMDCANQKPRTISGKLREQGH